jgi:hypothetical protein
MRLLLGLRPLQHLVPEKHDSIHIDDDDLIGVWGVGCGLWGLGCMAQG